MNKTANKILNIVLVLLIIGVIATPCIGTAFTFPAEDDFSYESGGSEGAAEFHSSFIGSIYKTYVIYQVQQGCYTSMFLDHFIRPYSRYGLPGFNFTMIFFMAFYLVSVYLVISVLFKNKTAALAAMLGAALSSFGLANSGFDTWAFFWYTGIVGYTLILAFTLVSLFLLLKALRTEGKNMNIYIAGSSFFAFLGSGGSLVMTSINCSFLLAALILNYDKVKEKKRLIVPFCIAFAGAIFNVVAPGNYVRANADLVEGHSTVFDAIRDTFTIFFNENSNIYEPLFIVAILLVAFLCYVFKVQVVNRKITITWMIVIAVGVFLIQYFTIFPAAFGYHGDVLSDHVVVIYDIVTRFTLIFLAACVSQFLREQFDSSKIVPGVLGGIFAVCTIFCLVNPTVKYSFNDSFTAKTYRDFTTGRFAEVYKIRQYVLSTFELAEEGSDCIIYVPWDTDSESLPGMGITSDSEWFVNVSAAHLFNLHTTTVLTP